MYFVIGSGAAGVSAAKALLAAKKPVTMIDVGNELNEKTKQQLISLGAKKRTEWSASFIKKIKAPMLGKDTPQKYSYGSKHSYTTKKEFPLQERNTSCAPSFAMGGLSSIWGAAIMPYDKKEISDWPVSYTELEPYYKKVLGFIPLSGEKDALNKRFPLLIKPQPLETSAQAKQLLQHFKKNKKSLEDRGFLFGKSRLAVHAKKCVYCGLCMFGCPYQLIYSSEETLNVLLKNPLFTYKQGFQVTRIEEKNNQVHIHTVHNGAKKRFTGEKVFVGCGPIPTAKIMLHSTKNKRVEIKDSQYVLLPIMTFKNSSQVKKELLHTLAQLFIEVDLQKYGNAHLQIYTYNELFEDGIQTRLGKLFFFIKPILGLILGRMMVIQGFLHSDMSHKIDLSLHKDKVLLQKRENSQTNKAIKVLLRKIAKNARPLGFIPLFPLVEKGLPGKGFHYGSSFPMKDKPKEWFETDVLGRPRGYKRLHIIDASVLPSIPGTTITLSIMANAYRIAHKAARGE